MVLAARQLSADPLGGPKMLKRISPRCAAIIGGLAVFAFVAGTMNAAMVGWLAWYRLSRDGQQIQGTITRREPEIHQTCYFKFNVGPKKYEGSDQGCHRQIGEIVLITYSPADPSFATTASPRMELIEQVVGAVVISCAAGLGIGWRLRREHCRSGTVGRPTSR
jgi:hypothetical protein